jgi:hyperosmotically inducible protein
MKTIDISTRMLIAAAAGIMLAGVAGCNRESSYQASRPATSAMGGPGEKVAAKVDDAKIVTKVKAGLASDKDLSAMKIDVDSRDGVVTLTGTVPSAAAQSRAAQIARDVRDVKSVDSRLTVNG